MIIPTYRFNLEKWNRENEFYRSELERGHIDLTPPMEKSFGHYWELGEIETNIHEKIDGHPGLIVYKTDKDFLIRSWDRNYLFSDYLKWLSEKKLYRTGDDHDLDWMIRELKLSMILD